MAGFWNRLLYGNTLTERAVTPPPTAPIQDLIPSRTISTRAVTSTDALSLSSVFRAVQVLATSLCQLSIDAYRGDAPLDPAPLFLREPDVDQSRAAFLEMTTVSLALQGNAFWRISRDNQGRVQNLRVLNPLDVEPSVDRFTGRVLNYRLAGAERPLQPPEVRHLKFMRVPGSARGLGPIQAAQRDLRGALDVRDYGANWFQDSGVPSGVLKTDQPITKDQADEARTSWDETPAGRTRVLGSGMDYRTMLLSPADAQFLESRQFSTTEIARLFGLPASLMLAAVEGNSLTYSNISQSWTELARFTLATYYREIEEAFTALLPRGTVARFNLEALLRPDTTTRYAMHAQAIQMGLYSPAYARRVEGIPETAAPDEEA
ncbi:MAG: phage portal protein [Microbacterium sp.]